MSSAREDLLQELIQQLMIFDIPVQDVKGALFLSLDKYEIENRTTELTVYEGDDIERFVNKFLLSKKVKGCTSATLRHYRNELNRFFAEIPKNPKEVTPDDIRKYLAIKEVRDKVSKGMLKNCFRVLSTFFAWMADNDHIIHNPVKKVESIRHKPHKEKAFTDVEVEKIREKCRDNREVAIIEFLLSIGCRVSEMCQVKISDINMTEGSLEVFGKGEKFRMVYLNARTTFALKRYLAERSDTSPYLFPRMKSIKDISEVKISRKDMHNWWKNADVVVCEIPADKGSIENIVRNLGRKAGVEKVHPHRFRKTCATNALKAGMPLELVSKMLGHESVETTQIYLDLSEEDLKQAHRKYVR